MTATIEMRQAVQSDACAVRQLTREAYAKLIPVIGREPKPMNADYGTALLHHRIDLLYVDGALVGLIETVDEGDQLLVENVAVAPEFQGRGLGAKLMAHADDIARSRGHTRTRLYTNQLFAENVELYLRLGFIIHDEKDVGAGTIRIDMSKDL